MKTQSSFVFAAALMAAVGCAQPASDANAGLSDAAVTASVKQKLASLDGLEIEVTTQNGVVKLTGTADDADVKARGMALARATEGATEIVDFIRVGPTGAAEQTSTPPADNAPINSYVPPPSEPVGYAPDIGESAGSGLLPEVVAAPATDASISTSVKAALSAPPQLRGMTIDVVTRSGVVTLSGTVTSEDAKARAADVASMVANVTRVDNQLTVRPNTR
jgi:osmotically-inducible protein OsmY